MVIMNLTNIANTTRAWAAQRSLPVDFHQETASTNDNAKVDALREANDLVLFLTAHQTQGRGRGVNQWLDTGAGEALLSSWSFRASSSPQAITAPRVGLAIYSAVTSAWPSLPWGLKAPNDLLLNGKKCGGILVESLSGGAHHRVIVGFGFNVFNHPRKLSDATHLAQAHVSPLDEGQWFQFLDDLRAELAKAVADSLHPTLNESACSGLRQALNANPNAKMTITKVTPQGDLIHPGGTVLWTEL